MTAATYWGPFAALRQMPNLRLTETAPYEGASAPLMSQMMETTVSLAPLGVQPDVEQYLALAASYGEPVLELGCGSGRILLELARHGHRVVGIERSPDMLAELRDNLRGVPDDASARVEALEDDVMTFSLGRRFPLIVLPAMSIMLFPPNDRRELLRRVAEHLAPAGAFAFDYIRFGADAVAAIDEHVVETQVPLDGTLATAYVGVKFSSDATRLLVNTYWQVRDEDETVVDHYLEAKELALVDEEELDEILDETGFVVERSTVSRLAGGMIERRMVRVGQGSGAYPLWHPHIPMKGMAESMTMLVAGEGSRVRADDGKEYVDASGGLWSTQCGLGHPDIIEAVERQLKRLSYGTLFAARSNEPALALARALVEMTPAPLEWAYLTNSGSESVELAIKLARLHFGGGDGRGERNHVAYLDESYHGTFFGSMGVTGLYPGKEELGPLLPGLVPVSTPSPSRCPADVPYERFALECATDLERRIEESQGRLAAFILEPVLGSAGVVVPPREYLRAVQHICRRHGVLLILDEVATGFGRTGRWFALEHFGLRPDILLLSKGITSGYLPLGAVLFSAEIGASLLDRGIGVRHGSSHNGNPACCAAALETIAVMRRERLVERAAETGAYFRHRLEELYAHPTVREVRSLGLMLGLELHADASGSASLQDVAALYLALQRDGVLPYPAPAGLAFMPPLVITHGEVDLIAEALHRALSVIPAARSAPRRHHA